MRAAIFASLVPAPETEKERKELEKLIKIIVDWDQVKDGNSEAVLKARQLVQEAFPDGPPKLLDPFMGGGSTGLEALRLGCETHAVELNPVAHLIELCTIVYPQKYGQPEKRLQRQGALNVEQEVNTLAIDVQKWGQWILNRAHEAVGELYKSSDPDETVVGYLWARTVRCPNPSCQAKMPLVRSWWLVNKKDKKVAIRPIINKQKREVHFEVVEDDAIDFDPSNGTTGRLSATCIFCNQATDAKYLQLEGQEKQLSEIPLATITTIKTTRKKYRPTTAFDRHVFQLAKELREKFETEFSLADDFAGIPRFC